ncbi:MAG TPA: PAS domain-containing protein [Stellaceae bacterium]|nr:PAS domain-containing protein [Stellaceae bacterium]
MLTDALIHPVLDSLLRYWNDKRGAERLMPERKDIDPLEMGARLLPHLLLCDLLERGNRIRFRVVGTNIVRRWGFEPTAKYLDEGLGPYFATLGELHHACFAERAPIYSVSAFRWGVNRELEAHHLLLPLSKGGFEPAIALAGIAFRSDEVFPPQIRNLNGVARFEERYRTIVDMSEQPARRVGIAGRNVA